MPVSSGTWNKIFVAVVSTVIATIVLAMLGFGGGGETTLNINGGPTTSGGSGFSGTQVGASATVCATAYGACPLPFGGQRGGPCVCNFGYGVAQGVAQ